MLPDGPAVSEPRRFDDEETRAIFERAAERQEQARAAERERDPDAEGGLSLEELQEIGRAAGIDPAHIAAAAEGITAGTRTGLAGPPARRDHGRLARFPRLGRPRRTGRDLPEVTAPSGKPLLHESRLVPRMDDATWERLVEALRRESKVAGITGQVGRVREWAKDRDSKESTPLTVRVVPEDDGDRIQVTEGTEQAYLIPKILGGVMAGNGALIGLLMMLPMGGSGPPVALPLIFGGIGAAVWGGGTMIAGRVSRRKAERLAAIADRLALLAADRRPD